MLNVQEIKLLDSLCGILKSEEKFKVVELSEISAASGLAKDAVPELIKRLCDEACVSVKYCDGGEYCLAVTRRGFAVLEDSKVVSLDALAPDSKIKFSPTGKPRAVIKRGEGGIAVPIVNESPVAKRKLFDFLRTVCASFIGSLAAGAIIVAVCLLCF